MIAVIEYRFLIILVRIDLINVTNCIQIVSSEWVVVIGAVELPFVGSCGSEGGTCITVDGNGSGGSVPDMFGKERRKAAPGKEGKLGVEGMKPEVLLEALHRAGATFEGEENPEPRGEITKADLYALGLSGGPDSSRKRLALLRALHLPEHMSTNAMLQALNLLYTRQELEGLLEVEG